MTQQSDTKQDNDPKDTGSTGGSQGSTTGYGTGQTIGQGTAPSPHGQNTPSNAGNAGVQPGEGGMVSEDRVEQMAHADGSSGEHDPEV